jgi:FAD/FMN-containing dehydrogenase
MPGLRLAKRSGGFTELDENVQQEIGMTFHGPVIKAGDAGYDQARQIYNGMFDRHPGLIIQCSGTADVIDAVNLAREHELVVAVRGGGHNVAGNSSCDDGLVIDLSRMRGVHVDAQTQRVLVQGGATWGDVDRETLAFGLVAPGGIVSETGVAGLTLSGGLGWMRNKYGLSCDNLIGAEVVTADGKLVKTSASENPELLWALKGGGGNFGVVTNFEFQLHPLDPVVQVCVVFYPVEDGASILKRWRDWVVTTPPEVSSAAIAWTGPASEHLPPPVHGKSFIGTGAVYAGRVSDGEKALEPLRHFGTPLAELVMPMPFRMFQQAFDWAFPLDGSIRSYWKSLYSNEFSDAEIDILVEAISNKTSPYSLVNIPHMGSVVRDVPQDAAAFATRSAPFMISLDGNWTDPADNGQSHIAWVRDTWEKLRPYSDGSVYLNFVGAEDRDADALTHAAYGSNYERLVTIKRRYDPDNMFRLNQNIRP